MAQSTLWKRVFSIAAIIGFIIGLYGLYDRFVFGHVNTNYGSYVPWGLWIAAYTMLIGASAGAFVIAAVIFITKRPEWYPVSRTACIVALSAFIGGMLSVMLDLGHPLRAINLYLSTNFTSIMGIMAWLYLLYGFVLVVMLYLSVAGENGRFLSTLSYLAIPFAVLFAGAEGALFGVVGARAVWESGLTPIVFLVEGALSGTAAVILGTFMLNQLDQSRASLLGRVMLGLLLLIMLLEWAEYSTALYASIPAKSDAVRTILFGPYWWVFWLIHLLVGVLIPLLLLATRPSHLLFIALAAALTLATAVSTKLNLVIPALTQNDLHGLGEAFTGPGLEFTYFPTLSEWALFIWIGSLAILIFLGGNCLHARIAPPQETQ